ncbi:hypothetical protein HK097_005988 [Rhizophlyctis rosea]|uniref:ERCC4 domain-containing protein n=1 Tax=Rhizophlyctis rosea TaxID=64517 RepID=A0AAD5S1N9_9FUNG|nr:hypothetical protein HK097_005988 [Rhizophlyctis rosea]
MLEDGGSFGRVPIGDSNAPTPAAPATEAGAQRAGIKPWQRNQPAASTSTTPIPRNSIPAQTVGKHQPGFDLAGPSPIRNFEVLTTPQKAAIFESPQSAAHVDRLYQVVGDQLTILVDTREMRTSICSILRNKFKMRAEVRQLAVGDYIVSNRVALERKTKSDLLGSVYNKRIFDQISALRAMCEVPMLIVEKDKNEGNDSMTRTAQYEGILATLVRTGIRVLFSESSEQTAQMIFDLATREAKEGAKIDVPQLLPDKKNHTMQFLLSIPGVSDVTAMAIMNARFKNLREFLDSDVDTLAEKIPGMTRARAYKIYDYVRHKFDPNAVGGGGAFGGGGEGS